MTDDIMLTIGEDGKASLYDDTYDITIHCESQEEQDEVKRVLENIPHWIPVTERLPEKSGEYLVTVKWVTGESDVDVYEYDARHKTWNDGESAGGERAVAWCNLPEPYKGVTE